jgi:hypothetical protein
LVSSFAFLGEPGPISSWSGSWCCQNIEVDSPQLAARGLIARFIFWRLPVLAAACGGGRAYSLLVTLLGGKPAAGPHTRKTSRWTVPNFEVTWLQSKDSALHCLPMNQLCSIISLWIFFQMGLCMLRPGGTERNSWQSGVLPNHDRTPLQPD